MDTLLRELRLAVRRLGKTPGFTLVAVLSLGLGIGANTTVFTWASAVLLHPFPAVADPDRVLSFQTADPNEEFVSLSYPDYRDYRDRATLLDGFVVSRSLVASLSGDGPAERVWSQIVSGNYFDVLRVRAALGRTFSSEEDRVPGAHPVVVLSHGLWQRRFGADPGIVGRSIVLNAQPCTVIGVMPSGFYGTGIGLTFDAWLPMMMQERFQPGGNVLEARGSHWLDALVRLKPGVDPTRAEAELELIRRQIDQEHPEQALAGRRVALFPLWRAPRTAAELLGPVLGVLTVVVGLVLLIACANVANLLLVRAVDRRREMAIRLSLGAGRGTLVRQLLIESAVLAVLGGAAGALVATWSAGLMERLVPPSNYPVRIGAAVDLRALAFTFVVSLVTAVLFGLVPALQASRPGTAEALKQEAGSVVGGRGRARLRHALVLAQVSLSVVLLVAAGLFARSLGQAQSLELGFNPNGVAIASFELFSSGYDRARGLRFVKDVLDHARALPGVTSVSTARRAPLGFGGYSSSTITVDGFDAPSDKQAWAYYNNVGPDYLGTMQMPLVQGRDLAPSDDESAPRVMIVNETMARRYWPGRSALGGRVQLGADWIAVVGVVKDSVYRDLGERTGPWFFLPVLQQYRPDMTLLVRTAGDARAVLPALAAVVRERDPGVGVFGLRTLSEHIGAASFRQQTGSRMLGLFGVLGLTLAAVGLYGVLSVAVAQRTREIGIRMALGAERSTIFGFILGQGMRLALAGLAIGAAVAAGATRLMTHLLLGVSPLDPLTFGAVAAVLAVVALGACLVPARRATHVDPMTALRYE